MAAPKYILYIDYMSNSTAPMARVGYQYIPMMASNLMDAIIEADQAFDPNNHYLIRIMEKCGKVEKLSGIWKAPYKAILCRRSHGWHQNTAAYCEDEHYAYHYYNKDFTYTEVVSSI